MLCAQCLWLLSLDALSDRVIEDVHASDYDRDSDRDDDKGDNVSQHLRYHSGQYVHSVERHHGTFLENNSSARERGSERRRGSADTCLPLALRPCRDAAPGDVDSGGDDEDEDGREGTTSPALTSCVRGTAAPLLALHCTTLYYTKLHCTALHSSHSCLIPRPSTYCIKFLVYSILLRSFPVFCQQCRVQYPYQLLLSAFSFLFFSFLFLLSIVVIQYKHFRAN